MGQAVRRGKLDGGGVQCRRNPLAERDKTSKDLLVYYRVSTKPKILSFIKNPLAFGEFLLAYLLSDVYL